MYSVYTYHTYYMFGVGSLFPGLMPLTKANIQRREIYSGASNTAARPANFATWQQLKSNVFEMPSTWTCKGHRGKELVSPFRPQLSSSERWDGAQPTASADRRRRICIAILNFERKYVSGDLALFMRVSRPVTSVSDAALRINVAHICTYVSAVLLAGHKRWFPSHGN